MDRIELLNRLRENHDSFMNHLFEGHETIDPLYMECDFFYQSVFDSDLSMEEIRLCLHAIHVLYTIRYKYKECPEVSCSTLSEYVSGMKKGLGFLRQQFIEFHSISMESSATDLKGAYEEARERCVNPEKKITCAGKLYESEKEKILKAMNAFEKLVGHQKEFDVVNDFLKMKEKYGLEWNLW